MFEDAFPWGREGRVGESADRDRDIPGASFRFPEDGGAAFRAEVEAYRMAAVTAPGAGAGAAFDADIVPPVEGRQAERAAGAPLAVEAMAQRHQLRLATAFGPQLPAGTGGDAGSAGHAWGAPP